MVKITDSSGAGFGAKVDSTNKLHVEAVCVSNEHNSNHALGQAYQLVVTQTPTAAADYFLYVKNTSDTDLVVEGFKIRVASAEQIVWEINPVGTASGTTATPVNCNASSGKSATGTFLVNNDITGITAGSIVEHNYHTSTETKDFNFDQDLIIPKNNSLAARCVTAGVALHMTFIFNYHEAD